MYLSAASTGRRSCDSGSPVRSLLGSTINRRQKAADWRRVGLPWLRHAQGGIAPVVEGAAGGLRCELVCKLPQCSRCDIASGLARPSGQGQHRRRRQCLRQLRSCPQPSHTRATLSCLPAGCACLVPGTPDNSRPAAAAQRAGGSAAGRRGRSNGRRSGCGAAGAAHGSPCRAGSVERSGSGSKREGRCVAGHGRTCPSAAAGQPAAWGPAAATAATVQAERGAVAAVAGADAAA